MKTQSEHRNVVCGTDFVIFEQIVIRSSVLHCFFTNCVCRIFVILFVRFCWSLLKLTWAMKPHIISVHQTMVCSLDLCYVNSMQLAVHCFFTYCLGLWTMQTFYIHVFLSKLPISLAFALIRIVVPLAYLPVLIFTVMKPQTCKYFVIL